MSISVLRVVRTEACVDCENENTLFVVSSAIGPLPEQSGVMDHEYLKRRHTARTGHDNWRQL